MDDLNDFEPVFGKYGTYEDAEEAQLIDGHIQRAIDKFVVEITVIDEEHPELQVWTNYEEIMEGVLNKFHEMPCGCCNVDTSSNNEYYMIQNELWERIALDAQYLCVGCAELRLERKLTANDFTDCPLNNLDDHDHERSRRFINRLTNE